MDKVAKAHKEITGLLFDQLPDFATNDFETRWAECEALAWAIVKRQGEEHEADLATAQAQVAVMQTWIEQAKELIDAPKIRARISTRGVAIGLKDVGTGDESADRVVFVLANLLDNALSAAPKVLHSEEAKWDTAYLTWPVVRLQRAPMMDYRGPDDVMPGVTFMGHDPGSYEKFPGKEAQVIVLDKQGEGE